MNDIQHLSVIQIATEQYAPILNLLAEAQGKGSNNLSVKLQDRERNIYYGCHGWWTQEKYNQFKNHSYLIELGVDLSRYIDAINAMYESIIDTTGMSIDEIANVPSRNFETALNLLGLTRVIDEPN